jgi:hypothetical protein
LLTFSGNNGGLNALLFLKNMSKKHKKKIIESVEVLTLVTLFLSSIYAVAPVV